MISTSAMLRLLVKAMPSPFYVRHGYTIHEWDVSGSCQRPRTREVLSRPLGMYRAYTYGKGSEKAYSLIMHVRCRMCECCRKLKSVLWAARAATEFHSGVRSWFGTLTLTPDKQFELLNRARRRLLVGGTDFDELSPENQFTERMTEINREVTLWLKRVRKESGAAIRYLLVAEAHKSGEPHLHILVTETDAERPVRYRTLAKQWHLGFTKFTLCENSNAVRYVCKYISKSLMSRVRASLRYGHSESEDKESEASKQKTAPEKVGAIKSKDLLPIPNAAVNAVVQESVSAGTAATLTDHYGGKLNGNDIGTEGGASSAAPWFATEDRLSASDEPPF